jgi:hypothetical protein
MPVLVSETGHSEKGRIFGCALLLCVAGSSASGEEDIFSRLTGTFGAAFRDDISCAVSPHDVTFAPDRSRAHFILSMPRLDYLGEVRTEAHYTVLAHDETGITMVLDGEQRLTDAGAPVVWIMRPAAGLDGYCWGRTDWPRGRCEHLMLRCAADMPLG